MCAIYNLFIWATYIYFDCVLRQAMKLVTFTRICPFDIPLLWPPAWSSNSARFSDTWSHKMYNQKSLHLKKILGPIRTNRFQRWSQRFKHRPWIDSSQEHSAMNQTISWPMGTWNHVRYQQGKNWNGRTNRHVPGKTRASTEHDGKIIPEGKWEWMTCEEKPSPVYEGWKGRVHWRMGRYLKNPPKNTDAVQSHICRQCIFKN